MRSPSTGNGNVNFTSSSARTTVQTWTLIFANPDGAPLGPDSVSSTVSRICRQIKLPKGASLHTLRHSHGSHLLAAGMDLPVVSERLGHSSVRVTADIYSHAIRGRDDEAARLWEEFQRQNQPKALPVSARPLA
jgi:site-specific recombinase XerD